MKPDKMSKTDELLLLGDLEGAAKNELRKIRGTRTNAQRMLLTLEAGEKKVPLYWTKHKVEIAHMREMCEHMIEQADRLEKIWLERLEDLKA